jgi:hypothetical protein|tara:strand:- start:6 stop:401 length:396 start_codon:yes stop_codon:yes gene_type:complete
MPTEDEFLGAIKMISGEEVLSKVSSVDDENGRYLILDNPIMVEEVTMDSRVGAKVSPWMKFSKERSFIVPMDRIITCVEVDGEVEAFYEMSISKIDPEYSKTPPKNQGRVGTVEESRAILESIFKRNNKWS